MKYLDLEETSLEEVSVDILKFAKPFIDGISEVSDRAVVFEAECLDKFKGVDVYAVLEYLIDQLGEFPLEPSIMWKGINANKVDVWRYIIHYHTVVDKRNMTMYFRYHDQSPINSWLQGHRLNEFVISGVKTMMTEALSYFLLTDKDAFRFL